MSEDLIFAGVALVPLTVGLVGLGKRFFPSAHGNVWLGMSLFLGIAGAVAVYVADEGVPGTFKGALALIVLGLYWGLSASKSYDETLKPPADNQ